MELVQMYSILHAKLPLQNSVAMTVSLSTLLIQKSFRLNALSVNKYSVSLSKMATVAISSVKHVLEGSKQSKNHAQNVTLNLIHFPTGACSELSINCKFDVCTKVLAVIGQESWGNLRSICLLAAAFHVNLAMPAARFE